MGLPGKKLEGRGGTAFDQNPVMEENKGLAEKEQSVVINLGEVKALALEWLVLGWVPLGKLTVLEGDPEQGKSTLAMDLAARGSRGLEMGDGVEGEENEALACGWRLNGGQQGRDVVLLIGEDSLEETVVPRLKAAEADLLRIQVIRWVADGKGKQRRVWLPEDNDFLEDVIGQTQSRLVIVEPFLAYLDRRGHSLQGLADLAERTRCAVVLLRQLNKQGSRPFTGAEAAQCSCDGASIP